MPKRKVENSEMKNLWHRQIITHYESCLAEHGASAKGMDWPNEEDLCTRFDVMLGVINKKDQALSLLDLGCGVGLFVDHLEKRGIFQQFKYWGIDVSAKMITAAKQRHPGTHFEIRDILSNPLLPGDVDFVIMNGVLTEKRGLRFEQMEDYAKALIKSAYDSCRYGLAFNVMSSHVDWQREDLFHWPIDRAVSFIVAECSRNILVRMDYGLYEYTIYIYRKRTDEKRT
jgi:SAM-dependent methyltransferase